MNKSLKIIWFDFQKYITYKDALCQDIGTIHNKGFVNVWPVSLLNFII